MGILSDREALLSSIITNPDDDVARLVYADWLQEHGEEDRAEFIRVQIELAKTPDNFKEIKSSCRYWGLKSIRSSQSHIRRCKNCQYQRLLKREVQLHPIEYTSHFVWTRGFISEFQGELNLWLTHGPAIVQEHPIQYIRITDLPIHEYTPWNFNQPDPQSRWEIRDYDIIQGNDFESEKELWILLAGSISKQTISFESQQAAEADLSQALIQWAKSKVQEQANA